ncbi:UNVERIFIED_CONTAM: hypothetical protein Sradi_0653300 [Sesamum radiatum]|uniref:RNase H type-1 domain-containing protein n=1 Tax=Sesamum radiatum TaxID=300843 RepID=A0AAW2VM18_SESRA
MPENGIIKLNYDGAIFSSSSEVGLGVIARDSAGACVWWKSARKRQVSEPEMVEALAAREAVLLARQFGWRKIVLEGDSANIHHKLNSPQPDSSTTGTVIRDIKSLVSDFDLCCFSLVRRMANKVAHCLARKASVSGNEGSCFPLCWLDICSLFWINELFNFSLKKKKKKKKKKVTKCCTAQKSTAVRS